MYRQVNLVNNKFYEGKAILSIIKKRLRERKRVPARAADTRLITPYTSYLLRGFQ